MKKKEEPKGCPKCGSMDFEYLRQEHYKGHIGYKFLCQECRMIFIVWYKITFKEIEIED